MPGKHKLTVELDRDTIVRAKTLAARRGTTVSRLVASSIERIVEQDAAYDEAKQRALTFLEEGFPLGGTIRATRDELHER